MSPLRPHRLLGDGLALRERTPRGYELAAFEIVTVEPGSDAAAIVDTQRRAEVRGQVGTYAVALLIEAWSSERVGPAELVRNHAKGRPVAPTRKVRRWQVYRLVTGRPHRVGQDQDTFDRAVQVASQTVIRGAR